MTLEVKLHDLLGHPLLIYHFGSGQDLKPGKVFCNIDLCVRMQDTRAFWFTKVNRSIGRRYGYVKDPIKIFQAAQEAFHTGHVLRNYGVSGGPFLPPGVQVRHERASAQ